MGYTFCKAFSFQQKKKKNSTVKFEWAQMIPKAVILSILTIPFFW